MHNITDYIDQRDDHLPFMTVRETLDFAAACTTGVKPKGNPKRTRSEVVMEYTGLSHVADTVVGNNMVRGVSGGQRRRVTFAEKMLSDRECLLCDEISTGLDAETTLCIVQGLKWMTTTGACCVVSLLQPSPQVFDLFDDVILLSRGEIAYHGPKDDVIAYFERLGFQCPPLKDKCDFLQDITTRVGQSYASSQGMQPRTHEEFVARWKENNLHNTQVKRLNAPWDSRTKAGSAEMQKLLRKGFVKGFWSELVVVLSRAWLNSKREFRDHVAHAASLIMVAFLLGWLTFQCDPKNFPLFASVFFVLLTTVAVGGSNTTLSSVRDRGVFYRQSDSWFLRSSTYVISGALCSLPLDFIVSLLSCSFVVLMTGLFRYYSFVDFLVFYFVIFLTTIAMTSLFKFVASITPDALSAPALNGVLIVVQINFAGLVIQYTAITHYWLWIYWMTPLSWGYRGLLINHFRSSAYTQEEGDQALAYLGLGPLTDWQWIPHGVAFAIGYTFFFYGLSVLAYAGLRMKGNGAGESPGAPPPVKDEFEEEGSRAALRPSPLAFTPMTVAFENLSYFVPHPVDRGNSLQLLNQVSGFALPGEMTALMGESGAGKTTLMDVIAGRKTLGEGAYLTGRILFNGHQLSPAIRARLLGYVEQNDIHTPTSTVREALTFSAFLRLPPHTDRDSKLALVDQVLNLLDLEKIADRVIGDPAQGTGLASEQRKRVTCAVELVANPPVLFLDEPTSGLDSQAASIVMRALRNIAATGRTVICTIHQPSCEIFSLFDRLLLLQGGGQVVFFDRIGRDCRELVGYFESYPDAPRLPENINPADWMLSVLTAGKMEQAVDNSVKDYAMRYKDSKMFVANKEKVVELAKQIDQCRPVTAEDVALPSFCEQFTVLVQSAWLHNWRNPAYTWTMFVFYIFCALFYGTVFGNLPFDTVTGVQSRVGFVYSSTLFSGLVAFNSVIPVLSAVRVVFYREKASRTYNVAPYAIVLSLTELPFLAISSLGFVAIVYWLVPLSANPHSSFGFYWFMTFLYCVKQVYLGQMFAVLFENVETAGVVGGALMMVCDLLSGFLIPYPDIPNVLKLLYFFNPTNYALSALELSALEVDQFYCDYHFNLDCPRMSIPAGTLPNNPEATSVFVWEYVFASYGFRAELQYWSILIVCAFALVFLLGRSYCLAYVSHLKR
eukprot:g9644.t1